jgi:hypothetical protein
MRDTIDMARETGVAVWNRDLKKWQVDQNLKDFEALVRADAIADEREQGQKWFDAVTAQHKQLILAEREACAKVCESRATPGTGSVAILNGAAAAIRNRGNT